MVNILLLVMLKTKIWILALGMIIAMPFVLFAEEQEVEIELIEVVGVLPGDNPTGNPMDHGNDPTQPTDFHATITGRTLAVTSNNANATQVIVRNAAGNVVVNTQFYGYTSQQLNASGAHSIEIYNGGLTLVGNFQAQ